MKVCLVAMQMFLLNLPREVLLAGEQLLEEEDAGRLEEVGLPHGAQTPLHRLQHLAHALGLSLLQGQGLNHTAEGNRS